MRRSHDIATFDDLQRFYGGAKEMRRRFGLSQPGLACWKLEGRSIPRGYHLEIYLELKMAGLTIDPDLFGIEGPLAAFMNRDRIEASFVTA